MQTVGKAGNNFEDVFWSISKPDGQYYIPDADGSMDCPLMKTRLDSLDNQERYWLNMLLQDLNTEEKKFATDIVTYLRYKKDGYNQVIQRNCTIIPETTAPADQPTMPNDVPANPYEIPQTTDADEQPTEKKTNWLLIGGIAAGVLLITKKKGKGMRKKVSGLGGDIVPLILIGGAAFLLIKSKGGSIESKKEYLNQVARSDSNDDYFLNVIAQMTDQEISDTYTFFKDYVNKGLKVPDKSDLWYAISAISNKYNIFT